MSYREKELETTKANVQRDSTTLANSDGEILQIQNELDQIEVDLKDGYSDRKVMPGIRFPRQNKVILKPGKPSMVLKMNCGSNRKIRMDAQILINQLKDKANSIKTEISAIAQRLRIEFEEDINIHINQPSRSHS